MSNSIGKKTAVLSAAAAFSLLTLSSASAQDFERVAPKELKTQQPPTVQAPEKPPSPPVAQHRLLLPALKGLSFVDAVGKIARKGIATPGITADPNLVLLSESEIRNQLEAFLGKPLYTDDLPKISQTVLDWYRAHNLPVVDVAFPEQDINSGTVQAVVTVYKLGQVKVEGNRWFSSNLLKSEMELQPQDPIDFAILKTDLNRLSRNPFRTVNAVLERSDTPGDTDIALNVNDRLPLRVYASFDYDGLPVTGRGEYSAGFNWGNVFGLDHQLSYRFITSPDLWRDRNRGPGHSDDPRFTAHSLNYIAPLPWGDTLNLFGSYVQQVPNLGPNFDQVGHSLQMGARYQKDLPALGALAQQIQVGFDYKRSDSNLAFGGTGIYSSATNVEQFLLIYDGTYNDSWGQTAVENQIVWSPGGMSDGNTTARFVASGVNGAKANYVYDNLQVTRVTYLPWQLSSVIRLDAQVAGSELLPSEQLGAGGTGSVRGYDPRSANGSQGLLASLELRSPSYSPLMALGAGVEDSGQLLAFFDSGFVSYLHDQTNLPRHATLESVGFGVRYGIGRYLDVSFDYGWQLKAAPGNAHTGNLANVSVTLAY